MFSHKLTRYLLYNIFYPSFAPLLYIAIILDLKHVNDNGFYYSPLKGKNGCLLL